MTAAAAVLRDVDQCCALRDASASGFAINVAFTSRQHHAFVYYVFAVDVGRFSSRRTPYAVSKTLSRETHVMFRHALVHGARNSDDSELEKPASVYKRNSLG